MKALLLLALLALAHESVAITFDLPAVSKKCLKEDVHKDILVVGEYELSPSDDQIVDLEITDSRDHPVYKKVEALKGKFAFTSDDYDTFSICFTNRLRDRQSEGIISLRGRVCLTFCRLQKKLLPEAFFARSRSV
eukprot:m.53935 g.53935  ORF g.53935 m.53935 type:complete len:135 (-) comp48671_c0_seq1:363-767(-)